jgi:hypothetical protein
MRETESRRDEMMRDIETEKRETEPVREILRRVR